MSSINSTGRSTFGDAMAWKWNNIKADVKATVKGAQDLFTRGARENAVRVGAAAVGTFSVAAGVVAFALGGSPGEIAFAAGATAALSPAAFAGAIAAAIGEKYDITGEHRIAQD